MEHIPVQLQVLDGKNSDRIVVRSNPDTASFISQGSLVNTDLYYSPTVFWIPEEVAGPMLGKPISADDAKELYFKYHFAENFVIDIDFDKSDGGMQEELFDQMKKFIKAFPAKYGEDYIIHFSGMKGYHIVFPWWKLTAKSHDPVKDEKELKAYYANLLNVAREICRKHGVTAVYDHAASEKDRDYCDHSVFARNRIMRVANSRHDKNNDRFCIAIGSFDLLTYDKLVTRCELNKLITRPDLASLYITKSKLTETLCTALSSMFVEPSEVKTDTPKATQRRSINTVQRETAFKCEHINLLLSKNAESFLRASWSAGHNGRRWTEWVQPAIILAHTEPNPDHAHETYMARLREIFGDEASGWGSIPVQTDKQPNCITMKKISDSIFEGTSIKPCTACKGCQFFDTIMTPEREDFDINELPHITDMFRYRLVNAMVNTKKIISINKSFYYYDGGVYKPASDSLILQWFQARLGKHFASNSALIMKDIIPATHIEATDPRINPENEMCMKNGIYNFKTKEFMPHDSEKIFFSQIEANWNPEVKSEVGERFLKAYFRTQQDWDDFGEALIGSIGYSMTTDCTWQKMFICCGITSDDSAAGKGKSTLLKAYGQMMGQSAMWSLENTEEFNARFTGERKIKARIVYVDDAKKNDDLEEDGLKAAVNDSFEVLVENKGKDGYTMKAYPHIWINTNYGGMKMLNPTSGYYRRLVKFPFRHNIVGTEFAINGILGIVAKDENCKSFLFHKAMDTYYVVQAKIGGSGDNFDKVYPVIGGKLIEEKTTDNSFYQLFAEHVKYCPGNIQSSHELVEKLQFAFTASCKLSMSSKRIMKELRQMCKAPELFPAETPVINKQKAFRDVKIVGIRDDYNASSNQHRLSFDKEIADSEALLPSVMEYTYEEAIHYIAEHRKVEENPFRSFARFMSVYRNLPAIPEFESQVARLASFAIGSPIHSIGELFFHGISSQPEVDARLMYVVNSVLNSNPEVKAAIEAKNTEMLAVSCEVVPLHVQQSEAFAQAFEILNDRTYDPGSISGLGIPLIN